MIVGVVSANLGSFDAPMPHAPQAGVEVRMVMVTSRDIAPRPKALSFRLQSKLPKMFGWEFAPDCDAYVWVDASLRLSEPDSVQWFLGHLGDADIAVFRHPRRKSAQAEADYVAEQLAQGTPYFLSHYEGEDLDGQMKVIRADPAYQDTRLYAAGAFCYRPTGPLRNAMQAWWYHTSRYCVEDQLAFPYVLWQAGCHVSVIQEDIFHASKVAWTRGVAA
jgi:hypothetical protein